MELAEQSHFVPLTLNSFIKGKTGWHLPVTEEQTFPPTPSSFPYPIGRIENLPSAKNYDFCR